MHGVGAHIDHSFFLAGAAGLEEQKEKEASQSPVEKPFRHNSTSLL
jgi:hypothetical protein